MSLFLGRWIMDNDAIAAQLMSYANHLGEVETDLYRRRAYRRAAEEILRLEQPVAEILAEAGRKALQELPGIGSHLAYTIEGLVRTGQFRTLNANDRAMDLTPVLMN